MLTHYKSRNVWWYDLTGYGQEGKIEGMQYDDIPQLTRECLNYLEPEDLLRILREFENCKLLGEPREYRKKRGK
jgi:hypothetical protein